MGTRDLRTGKQHSHGKTPSLARAYIRVKPVQQKSIPEWCHVGHQFPLVKLLYIPIKSYRQLNLYRSQTICQLALLGSILMLFLIEIPTSATGER